MCRDDGDVCPLTVVLTTSPCVSHPSTYLMQNTMLSLTAHCGPLARRVPIIIVCDGYALRDADAEKSVFRQAKVTREDAERYARYLNRLEVLCARARDLELDDSPFRNASMLVLREHHGFPYALRRGLQLVKTPLVMVLQHDRSFTNDVDLARVCREMQRCCSWLYYVGFPTKSTIRHDLVMRGQTNGALVPTPLRTQPARDTCAALDAKRGTYTDSSEDGLTLLPLCRFFDSTHVARTAWYTNFIFGRNAPWAFVRRGFVEEKVTEVMTPELLSGGLDEAHKPYGMYVLWPDGAADRPVPLSYDAREHDAPMAEPYGGMWPTVVGHVNGHRDGLERKMQHQVSFVLDAEIDAYDAATRREPAQLVM